MAGSLVRRNHQAKAIGSLTKKKRRAKRRRRAEPTKRMHTDFAGGKNALGLKTKKQVGWWTRGAGGRWVRIC